VVCTVRTASAHRISGILRDLQCREKAEASLDEPLNATAMVEKGVATSAELDRRFSMQARSGVRAPIRHRFQAPRETLRELFSRMLFNILCGNTDDHARNHAAFCNGKQLSLTPAYDICPQNRTGGEATPAMLIMGSSACKPNRFVPEGDAAISGEQCRGNPDRNQTGQNDPAALVVGM
jgi:HipA-like C-terminal domain